MDNFLKSIIGLAQILEGHNSPLIHVAPLLPLFFLTSFHRLIGNQISQKRRKKRVNYRRERSQHTKLKMEKNI